ncbi:protoporphyrinogen oxidase-like [Planoprotostelium fungivorum]|uniref:Protoporphyrinogen oxidase n=1 Tax=Planoprotostelium fungivorum TaxID=1890364 RepID=A0A2P6N8Z1_9EUKA|nr:protoporphyrinogen oxidase-like [Planoprotostelium fungivorum]
MTRTIAILGGGVSGLTAGYLLSKKFPTATLHVIEGSSHFGGWVKTKKHSTPKGDFLFEKGPRSIRPVGNGKKTLGLIEDLGLNNAVIFGKEEAAKRRFVLSGGQVKELPSSLFGLFGQMGRKILPGVLLEAFKAKKEEEEEETIDQFFRRRFGDTITDELVAAMALGIWGGDIRKLSMDACFPSLVQFEKQHGSVLKGMLFPRKKQVNPAQTESEFVKENTNKGSTFSFEGGLQTLVDGLVDRLSRRPQVQLHPKCKVRTLRPSGDGKLIVEADDLTIYADEVISTLPASAICSLLPPDSPTAIALKNIPSVSIAAINLGYHEDVLPSDVRGFGYLVPPREGDKILGVTFDSVVFPQHNDDHGDEQQTRLTVMMGGDLSNGKQVVDVKNVDEKEIESIARDALKRHLDYMDAVVCRDAIPQYTVGHQKRVKEIKEIAQGELGPKVYLTGTTFNGAGINDCIVSAMEIVDGMPTTP